MIKFHFIQVRNTGPKILLLQEVGSRLENILVDFKKNLIYLSPNFKGSV